MSAARDGGPAFPAGEAPAHPDTCGMSLRDYFAGQALAGMMSRHTPGRGDIDWQSHAAWDAYSVASAMLAERAKGAA